MELEIRPQLVGCSEECQSKFLELSVACLNVEQILPHIVEWKLFVILLSDEHGAHGSFRNCKLDVELFPIVGFGEERRKSEILLKLLEGFLVG